MLDNTSKKMRNDQLFIHNEYFGCGKWNISLIKTSPEYGKHDLVLISRNGEWHSQCLPYTS